MSPHDPDPREDQVRALLTGLPPETTPPDVVERLDEVVARLARERSAGAPSLAERRTRIPVRRRVPRAAVAAAATVALLGGAAVAAQQGLLVSGGSSADSSAAGRAEGPGSASPGAPASGTAGGSSSPSTPSSGSSASARGTAGLPALSSASFARDVAAVLARDGEALGGSGQDATPQGPMSSGDPESTDAGSGARLAPGEDQGRDLARHQDDPGSTGSSSAPTTPGPPSGPPGPQESVTPGCTPPRTSPSASTRPVTLDGRPAVLVIGPVLDGTRTVSAWPCGSRTPAATAQVPSDR